MNILDIRPHCQADCAVTTANYQALCAGELTADTAEYILPDRATLGTVWRYLAAVPGGQLRENPICLCRKIVRWSGMPLSLEQLLVCLDIFADVELIAKEHCRKHIAIHLIPQQEKADLSQSRTMQRLIAAKES